MSTASRTWTACTFVLTLACGDAAPESGTPSVLDARTAPSLAPESARADAPAMVAPAELASACLRGDPAEGVDWALDGVTVSLLPFVGIESLASRDSARLAARIAAAVDVLPSDTSVADFRGLPVAVRAAWRVVPADGDTTIIALAARRVPIESEPLEELFAIVAAPGQRQGVRDPILAGWVMREVGREEVLVTRELVGAFHLSGALTLVLAHDGPTGTHAEMVVRDDGRWRTAWAGPIPSCSAGTRSR